MMFRSFARNSSCVPLSCGLGLGFIPSPPNKIARFRRSTHRNLAISPHKNQQQSPVKMRFYSIFNGGLSREERLKLLESQGAFQYEKDSDQSVEILGQLHIVSKHLHNISRFLRILSIAMVVYVVISLLNF